MSYKKYKSEQSKVIHSLSQKIGLGWYLMSGTYTHHISLTNLTQPTGLHREFYRVIDLEKDDLLDESNLELVKYRQRL